MKASTIFSTVALLFASSVSAQTACNGAALAVPSCGVPCIESAAAGFGCSGTEYKCRCEHSDAIQSQVVGCVISGCGSIDKALEVQRSASAVCACAATAAPDAKRAAIKF